jgi:hypothetical protein
MVIIQLNNNQPVWFPLFRFFFKKINFNGRCVITPVVLRNKNTLFLLHALRLCVVNKLKSQNVCVQHISSHNKTRQTERLKETLHISRIFG